MSRPDDYVPTVRARARGTTGYILARHEPCLGMAHTEADAARGRRLTVLTDPPDPPPKTSWAMAVVLCNDDDVRVSAAFVRRLRPQDRARVRFFRGQALDDAAFVAAWTGPLPLVTDVRDWRGLHRSFGLFLNDWSYRDASG